MIAHSPKDIPWHWGQGPSVPSALADVPPCLRGEPVPAPSWLMLSQAGRPGACPQDLSPCHPVCLALSWQPRVTHQSQIHRETLSPVELCPSCLPGVRPQCSSCLLLCPPSLWATLCPPQFCGPGLAPCSQSRGKSSLLRAVAEAGLHGGPAFEDQDHPDFNSTLPRVSLRSLFQHYCYSRGGMRHTSYTCICCR